MENKQNYGDKAYQRTTASGSEKSNTNGGRVYKRDFQKDGTDAPASWGKCLSGSK